jgi:hypothetical protein
MSPTQCPSKTVIDHVTRLRLQHGSGDDSSYYNLLVNLLSRAKGMAGLIGTAAGATPNSTFDDITETAYAIADELDIALCLLEGWFNDHRGAERRIPPDVPDQAREAD